MMNSGGWDLTRGIDDTYFIGRKEHADYFKQVLKGKGYRRKRLINIYGTGGVGKSTLLDIFKKHALMQDNVMFISLESRDFIHTEFDFCQWLLNQLKSDYKNHLASDLMKECYQEIGRLAQDFNIVLAIDTYEELSSMDSWLRERFLINLPESVIVIISGRSPLKGQWALSSYWRERVHYIPLQHFSKMDVHDYLTRHSIVEDHIIEDIWKKSKGHPFTLSLLTFCQMHGGLEAIIDQGELYQQLASIWLKELEDDRLRSMVEAASILRHFHLEVISFLLGEEITPDQFKQLTEVSFIRKAGRGWVLHDIMKEATLGLLKEQTPSRYAQLVESCVKYYYRYITQASSNRDLTWEVGELFYYIGSARMRALYNQNSYGEYQWETLTQTNLHLGEQYLQERFTNERDRELVGKDPETGKVFKWKMTKEETLYILKDLNLPLLTSLDQDAVRILVSPGDQKVKAMAVIIPINHSTMPYLEGDSFLGPYFTSIPKKVKKIYEGHPNELTGWAIRSIDVADSDNELLRLEALNILYQHICSRKVVITSPPPFEMYTLHLDLGFEVIPDIVHTNYDGITPTKTFILDTRGEKLEQFLQLTLERIGYQLEQEADAPVEQSHNKVLTDRENEIADLVYEGKTNLEIAKTLFISEITVKKHLTAIYTKLGIRNRNELIRLLGSGR
ncbi:MAG: LuxR C-terminal-related transcriptional regulator [Neobacillus sp.]